MKNIEFGKRLSQLMAYKGISQTLLAQFCQTTQQTVSRWCNGQCEPDLQNIYTICAVLDESPNELFDYNEEEANYFVQRAIEKIVTHGKEYQKEQTQLEKELQKQGRLEQLDDEVEKLVQKHLEKFYQKYNFRKGK
ncbi:MAG TPA: helix-turn-helix transcriptional regulator [Candidatus Borkfalkia faecavium]|uniref:Helix-turn-helix transcriptional regulator n=1 Tax=Candidatus Borkfalkia faecavium TaxID=2838508 RepID=A0A9D2AV97_9FIRM|nr:helix-turn-helix transcriptional regulator [Candidatus Borkfalkia faecavium]